MVNVCPASFFAATQNVRGFSSVVLSAPKFLSDVAASTDDAAAGLRYDSSIQPVNESSPGASFDVGIQCGKSAKRVSTLICPSAAKAARNNAMRRSNGQLFPIHGVPVFH